MASPEEAKRVKIMLLAVVVLATFLLRLLAPELCHLGQCGKEGLPDTLPKCVRP